MVNAMFLLTVVPMEERVLEVGIVLLLMRVELVELVCYSYGLLTVVLLYENAPGLIWGYHYVNFSVFTYVSDCFSKVLGSCTVQEISMVDGSTSEALQTVYCTWRCPWFMGDILHSVLYMRTPHRSYLYIR